MKRGKQQQTHKQKKVKKLKNLKTDNLKPFFDDHDSQRPKQLTFSK